MAGSQSRQGCPIPSQICICKSQPILCGCMTEVHQQLSTAFEQPLHLHMTGLPPGPGFSHEQRVRRGTPDVTCLLCHLDACSYSLWRTAYGEQFERIRLHGFLLV